VQKNLFISTYISKKKLFTIFQLRWRNVRVESEKWKYRGINNRA